MKEVKGNRILSGIALASSEAAPSETHDLGLLADELFAIANELRRRDRIGSDGRGPINLEKPSGWPETTAKFAAIPQGSSIQEQNRAAFAAAARHTYARRRTRASIFDNGDIFGEPAWDILLDLYIAHAEKKPVSVSSACIGSAAPPTTGLRWLGVLADIGLVMREHDKEDQRRVLVRLTERGVAAMDEYFANALNAAP